MTMKQQNIINEAERIEEDSTVSAKGHFCAAKRWGMVNFWLGIITTILASFAGAFTIFSGHNGFVWGTVIAGICSVFAGAISAVITFVNPNRKASSHFDFGNSYNELQNDTRIFRKIVLNTLNEENNREKLLLLNSRRNELNKRSDQIPEWAFKNARRGIEEGEAAYCVDEREEK